MPLRSMAQLYTVKQIYSVKYALRLKAKYRFRIWAVGESFKIFYDLYSLTGNDITGRFAIRPQKKR